MKTSTIVIIVVVVVVLLAIIAYKKGYFSKAKVIKAEGSQPNPQDCGAGRGFQCTKPIFSVAEGSQQKCWTYEQLGFEPTQGSMVITTTPIRKMWYYNYQSGNYYCFTDKKCCKGLDFPSNPQDLDEYTNPCGETFFYFKNGNKWIVNSNIFDFFKMGDCSQQRYDKNNNPY